MQPIPEVVLKVTKLAGLTNTRQGAPPYGRRLSQRTPPIPIQPAPSSNWILKGCLRCNGDLCREQEYYKCLQCGRIFLRIETYYRGIGRAIRLVSA